MTWGVAGLEVRIGSRIALSGVNLEFIPGSIAAVVGGDGAGKTTLARVVARLVRVESGRVALPVRSKVGFQPASSGSWPDLTVTENLRFVADSHRLAMADMRRALDELLAVTGLGRAADRLAGQLSGGMRQKLGVAMALMARPQLLILDEPTTGVDPVSRTELWRLISRTAANGTAVAVTTTYLDEAERAGHILALDEGSEVASGTPESIRAALPGTFWETTEMPQEPFHRWRRGREWRVWVKDGSRPPHSSPVEPDLADLLTARILDGAGSP